MTLLRRFAAASLPLSASLIIAACAAPDTDGQDVLSEVPGVPEVSADGSAIQVNAITEAPTGYDGLSNGFSTQADMDAAAEVFREIHAIEDGLGPVYNDTSCAACHHIPVLGGSSNVLELRAGHFNGTQFVEAPGGSLIQAHAIDPAIQEVVPPGNEVRANRISLATFGDGFVEAINNSTIIGIANSQPAAQRGTAIQVPVLEAPGTTRIGRFGWKDQNGSLLSDAAEEYIDEIGITSRLRPVEETSNGNPVDAFDHVPDPEDTNNDLDSLALFMRSLKAPPVDAARAGTASAVRGSNLFNQIGCAVCHVRTITTAPAGTVINGGAFTVPAALGDKNIHPLCDFLLHDVGTGDGIVQNGGQGTRNKVRTACLWGVRTRDHLMHDGASPTLSNAISRHGNQAAAARNNFNALSTGQKQNVLDFLGSL
jgi:CxxC motif-containing protein (DUF1111 family)